MREHDKTYPNIEPDRSTVGVEHQRMDLNAESGYVLLLELAGHVTLHKRGFSGASVTDENTLECGDVAFSCHFR